MKNFIEVMLILLCLSIFVWHSYIDDNKIRYSEYRKLFVITVSVIVLSCIIAIAVSMFI